MAEVGCELWLGPVFGSLVVVGSWLGSVFGLWVKWVVGRQSSPVLQGHGKIGMGHGDEFGGDRRGSPHG